MLFREIRAFIEGVRAAFPSRSDRPHASADYPDSPARITGQSIGFLAIGVVIWAAAVVTAVSLAGKPSADGSESKAVTSSVPATKDEIAEAIAWDDDVPAREWTAIVLHHSATEGGSAASFDAYHRQQKGWQCLGYHFVIGNGSGTPDGAIEAGPRWRRQKVGAHANSLEFNRHGIGICLVGNFEHASPTPAQRAAARKLVSALARRFQISPERILGHCDIREGGSTLCPGRYFPMDEIRESIGDCRFSTAD